MGTKRRVLSAEMGQHLAELGFASFDDYEAWAARGGLRIAAWVR